MVRTTPDLDDRERLLMNMDSGRLYNWMLTNIFPQMRRVECLVEYTFADVAGEEVAP